MSLASKPRRQLHENSELTTSTAIELETPSAEETAAESLRRIAGTIISLWVRIANSRLLAYAAFTAIYVPTTVVLAREKLFWDDEFFTLYLSRTRSWSDLIAALSTGADQHPPSFYYLTHLIVGIFGTTHVTLRLPAILGYALMCFCLYEIVSRLMDRPWGFAAMLLPLTCPAKYYTVEARGYGPQLGFVTLALLMWMLAADGRRRSVTLPLLAISLCGAIASHYYAVLVLVPLGVAELVRAWRRHKLDAPMWAAFLSGLIPLLVFMPTILKARSYSAHFWAVPDWHKIPDPYAVLTGPIILIPVSICALAVLLNPMRHAPSSGLDRKIYGWQVVGFILLSLLPIWAMVVAKCLTHAYDSRYVVAVFPAICILLSVGLARMSRYRKEAAALLWALSLVGFFTADAISLWKQTEVYEEVKVAARLLRQSGQMPIALADPTVFHRISFYAEPELAHRVVYLSDPHATLRYLKQDTVDRGLLALNPWFPLNVEWLHAWLSRHSSFLMYASLNNWTWLPRELSDAHEEIKVLKVPNPFFLLMSVRNLNVPPDDRVPGDPSGEPMLYSKIRSEKKSLCELYMPSGSCPNLY